MGIQFKTLSRDQHIVVLLMIFGMALLYFHSINIQSSQEVGLTVSANNERLQSSFPHAVLSHPATLKSKGNGKEDESVSGAKLLTLNKQIDLNMASKHDLEAIPGIGKKTAEKIVDYREKYGPFKRLEDIKNVSGIKEKKFKKIKMFLTVK